jgi:ClpP class serine protease
LCVSTFDSSKLNMLSNRNIDSLLLSDSRWSIDASFALSELNRYLSDLDARETGASYSELGIQQRKRAMLPKIATSDFEMMKAASDGTDSLTATDIPRGSFAVLNLYGTMRADGDWCSYGMRDFADWIDQANQNKRLVGILINANTGGGETMAGQILRNAVAASKKPVVVYADLLASAGVDGTLPADEIIASGSYSQIGSVGVYCSINKKMVAWYKENFDEIYASQSTKKNEEFRAYLKGNPELIQQEVSAAAELFHENVKQYRPKAGKNADVLAGKLFSATEAKKAGLIDGIGNIQYALNRLQWHVNNS